MQPTSLAAEPRESHGKGPARRLRVEGRVPALLYGMGGATVHISVDEHAFGEVVRAHGPGAVVSLEMAQGAEPVVVHEMHRHPVSLRPLSVDFLRIDLDKPIVVDVPVTLRGTPEGLSVQDVIMQLMHTVRLEILPTRVPSEISVDITGLTSRRPITADALVAPEGGRLLAHADDPVVSLTIGSPLEVEVAAAEEAGAPEGEEAEEPAEG